MKHSTAYQPGSPHWPLPLLRRSEGTAAPPAGRLLVSLLCGLLTVGCTVSAQPIPSVSPSLDRERQSNGAPNLITGNDSQTQGRFKIKLTLTSPEDLKVQEGENITAGQILADKVRDRSRLQFERENILREIGRLRKGLNFPIPDVKPLPEADYMEEAAHIEATRQKSLEAIRKREQQQRKIDVLQSMDSSELPEEIIPHEQILLEERQREENQSRAAVDLAVGKLNKAKELRQREEYAHSLEMSKRAIAIREHELKTQGTISDLEARLSQVEISLSQLSAVRSPYGGRIQKIKFVGQSDTSLTVELTLGVTGQRPGPGFGSESFGERSVESRQPNGQSSTIPDDSSPGDGTDQ